MDFFTVVNERRSVREYVNERVPREVLEGIVAAGIEAPSGVNEQLRQYIIVDEPEVLEPLRQVSKALATAAAAIVLLVEPQETKFGAFWVQDASAAMENILLAATALGYAGCWIEGAVRRHEPLIREALGVPDSLRVISLTPVGRPAGTPERPPKSDPTEVIHYNRFGEKAATP